MPGFNVAPAVVDILLKDPFAPIKQMVLQYIIDHALVVSHSSLACLLFDKNSLVRQRAARLLSEQNIDPVLRYLDVFNSPNSLASKRKIALLGLDEHNYHDVITFAEYCIGDSYPGIYISALKIIVQRKGDDARSTLFDALCHPSRVIAKVALRIFYQRRVYLTLAEIQLCLQQAPSIAHIPLYYSLAHKLNKWDWLIFILSNADTDNTQLTQEHINHWGYNFNRSGIIPTANQKEQLRYLFDKNPEVISKRQQQLDFFLS